MDQTQGMRSALEAVPQTLLKSETVRILDGVLSSLDIIDSLEARRPVVVLVGPTGAGKSYVFNAIVGADASPEGVLRPTTSSVIVAGDLPGDQQLNVPEAAVLPHPDVDFTLVDMPDGKADLDEPDGLLERADLVVMVVSPIRYADATVAKLWGNLDQSRAVVLLNRVSIPDGDLDDLVDSVTDMFGTAPFVVGEHGEEARSIADYVAGQIPSGRSDAMTSIMFRSAAAGTRFIVREVTNAATDIGKVTTAVDAVPECASDPSRYDVQVSWNGTRDEIVKRVAIGIRDSDDDIMRGSGTALGERILTSIGPWEEEPLSTDLDAWRDDCVATFTGRSSVYWRRSNAHQLIEQFSWSTAINRGTVAPKRFSRIMGAELDESTSQMESRLEDLICEHFDTRLRAWRAELNTFGEYQPGALASAADAFEGKRSVRG